MRLAGKVALVTGGASGIGEATARLCAREGARVVVADRRGPAAEDVAEAIKANGGEATAVAANVADAGEVEAMVAQTAETYGGLDVLVNNAGINRLASATELSEELWDRIVDVDLKSVWLGCKYAIPVMRRGGRGGTIVNTASISGIAGDRQMPAYNAAKAGVINLTRALAIEYGRDNIRVNCVCPGAVLTRLLLAALTPEVEARIKAAYPLGRLGRPEEIANGILFLASDESSFVTGAALVMDGGVTAFTGQPGFLEE